MSDQKICKLNCNGKPYYLLTTDEAGGLSLRLTDTTKAWRGEVSKEEWSSRSKQIGMADYESQTRVALGGDRLNDFEYEIKENADSKRSLKLIWKKVIEEDHIKFELGSALLESVAQPSTVIASMFDDAIESTENLSEQVAALKTDRDQLSADRLAALKKLEECVAIKEQTEKDLYSKFVLVLNAKKAKLRQLKAQLDIAESGSSKVAEASSSSHTEKSRVGKKKQSGYESDEEMKEAEKSEDFDTDDEDNFWQQKAECSTVSSSKQTHDASARGQESILDLMLDEPMGDDDSEMPVVAKKGKKTREKRDQQTAGDESSSLSSVPRMLSTTGTSNTLTTSSEQLRHQEKPNTKKKKVPTATLR